MNNMLGVFDVGGTGYRSARVDARYQISDIRYGETNKTYNKGLLNLIGDLESSGAGKKFNKIVGCIAGVIDQDLGELKISPNLENWIGRPFRTDLEKEFKCEVQIENDAAAEGLGETFFGAGKGYTKVGYFTAGTGIGGSIIQIQDSRFKMQDIEPGWTHKIGDKYLEEVAGGKALGDITKVDWKKETEVLALGINKTFENLNPEIIVLGGSLFKSIDLEYLQNLVSGKVVRGILGQEAGLWGCLRMARNSED